MTCGASSILNRVFEFRCDHALRLLRMLPYPVVVLAMGRDKSTNDIGMRRQEPGARHKDRRHGRFVRHQDLAAGFQLEAGDPGLHGPNGIEPPGLEERELVGLDVGRT